MPPGHYVCHRPYGHHQKFFVQDVRNSVDAVGSAYFESHDWRQINPKDGARSSLIKPIDAGSFNVKSVACWVPHLLIGGGFKPTCPHCEQSSYIDLNKCRWIENPKILHGVSTHRYLDTKYYHCSSCGKDFTGYNLGSMKLDQDKYLGFFNFHLSKKYAIDMELFTFITTSYDIPTHKLYKNLQQMATDKYLQDQFVFYHAQANGKIRREISEVVHLAGRPQRTIQQHAVRMAERESTMTDNQKEQREANTQLRKLEREINRLKAAVNDPIDLRHQRDFKRNRNNLKHKRKDFLPMLGVGKLTKLINAGIMTGRQMLEFDAPPPDTFTQAKFDSYKMFVHTLYEERQAALSAKQPEFDAAKARADAAAAAVTADATGGVIQPPPPQNEPRTAVEALPKFSKMFDKQGYNCRVISSGMIKRIRMTDFLRRKKLQQAKMFNQVEASDVLSIDFAYKLADNIKVYNGVGKVYTPYKCHVTIQDRNCCTIWHKVCSGAEAMDECTEALKALRDRAGAATVKVIYVDNPRSTQNKLKAVFPDAEIKDDPFHWLKRWSDALADPNSEKAAQFRALMSRALFHCQEDEYSTVESQVKERLIAQKRLTASQKPSRKQVLKHCRTVIPSPVQALKAVMAVVTNCHVQDCHTDLEIESRSATDTSPLPKRFFKSRRDVVNAVCRKQFGSVSDGFLSDPVGVDLYRRNPQTQALFCCRGTNSNENDNFHLRKLTDSSLGIGEADRVISTYFELANDRKRQRHLGELQSVFTYRYVLPFIYHCSL